jgi:RNA polymerase sigma factor (sigma-70 family)
MSKPLAAKGVGARFLSVLLITRLLSAAPRNRRRGRGAGNGSWRRAGKPPVRPVSLSLGARDDGMPDDGAAGQPPAEAGAADVATLYRAQGPRLLRFFRRRAVDSHEAQDLVQETFTRLLGSDPRRGVSRPEAYLTRIAQNLLRDRAKIGARRSADRHVVADESILAGTDQIHLLETRDLLDRLELAMLELPKETREIFMAHRLEGLTYNEIAERAGLTVKQVEWALTCALVELDRALGPR